MNIIYDLNDYSKNNIHFLEKKRNMMMDGNFTKLLYSNEYFTTIGLFLDIKLNILVSTSYVNNKSYTKIQRTTNNNNIISQLIQIEEDLLDYYIKLFTSKKKKTHLLSNVLSDGNIKIYRKDTKKLTNIILKISGIWENETNIGITYKFIEGINYII